MKKKAHKTPSRMKYDANNPTVSIRVSHQTYDQLRQLRDMSGKSLGDILREALKQQVPSVKDAYSRGYEEAKAIYGVTFKCCVCGGGIIIDISDLKEEAARLMKQEGWGHAGCVHRGS